MKGVPERKEQEDECLSGQAHGIIVRRSSALMVEIVCNRTAGGVVTRFTRADLTLAALTAPIWRPSEHPTRWPAEALYPDLVRRWMDELSRFRIRDHALRMYREHRRATARAARPTSRR